MAAAGMKRNRESMEIDMARCLMLLSRSLQNNQMISTSSSKSSKSSIDESFECKTCNKKFPSFQALGGHRASHKRPKLMDQQKPKSPSSPTKPKMHQCSICGLEFGMGQALGGHMRRHRAAMTEGINNNNVVPARQALPLKLPVFRRSNSSKRVFGLDLNLTPLENDLEILFGKMAPKVDPKLF